MKTILSLALMAILIGTIITPVFADSKLDSMVNLAMRARLQIKIQIDSQPNVPDEVKALYEQGSRETEILVSAGRQGDVEQAKQHFMSAMKTFRQVSLALSEPAQVALKAVEPTTPPPREIDYGNSIKRIESFINKLKGQTAKNGLAVDYTRIDSLIELSKTSLANGDRPALEQAFAELKIAITETQNAIKEMIKRANDRTKEFANAQVRVPPEKVETEQQRPTPPPPEKVETEQQRPVPPPAPETAAPVERPTSDSSEDRARQDAKNQRTSADLERFAAKLAEIQPYVDENIKPKFERAESLLSKLQNQEMTSNSDYKRTVKMLNLLLDQMERYVKSLQAENTNKEGPSREQTRNQDPGEIRPSK